MTAPGSDFRFPASLFCCRFTKADSVSRGIPLEIKALPPRKLWHGGQHSRVPVYSPLGFAFRSLVPSPPAGHFLCRQRKCRKKPLKGTYFEAVPLRIPPRRPKGLRPLWNPGGGLRGRETKETKVKKRRAQPPLHEAVERSPSHVRRCPNGPDQSVSHPHTVKG